jgi:hypothetical protein
MSRLGRRLGQLSLDLSLALLFTGTVVLGGAVLTLVASWDLILAVVRRGMPQPEVTARSHGARPRAGPARLGAESRGRPARRPVEHATTDA